MDYMGYMENTETLGSELVTDGAFPNGDNWTEGANWLIAGGSATHSGAIDNLSQASFAGHVGDPVKIIFSVALDVGTTGTIRVFAGSSSFEDVNITNILTAYTVYLTVAGSTSLILRTASSASIENVSGKQVL